MEQELQQRETELLTELATKFKANPIPASSLLPRYDKIKLSSSTKASEARERRARQLQAISKPFEFSSVRRPKRSARQDSGNVDDTIDKVLKEINKSHAKKERIKSGRSNNDSSIVQSAAKDGAERRRKKLEIEKRAGITKEHTFAPKINKVIPDFARLQREFLDERKKPEVKPSTRPEPFSITDEGSGRPIKDSTLNGDSLESIDLESSLDTAVAARWPFIQKERPTIGKEFAANYVEVDRAGSDTRASALKKQQREEKAKNEELQRQLAQETLLKKELKAKVRLLPKRNPNFPGARTGYPGQNRGGSASPIPKLC